MIGGIYFEAKLLPEGLFQNKMASCLGTFFIGNMIAQGLTKTNAFEIYLNEQLLWSTLKTQRKPNMRDLIDSFQKVNIKLSASVASARDEYP